MKTTQKELIMQFVKIYGEITPARLSDRDKQMPNGFIGSEVKRRCCELRSDGYLVSSVRKKFVVFTLPSEEVEEEPEEMPIFKGTREALSQLTIF